MPNTTLASTEGLGSRKHCRIREVMFLPVCPLSPFLGLSGPIHDPKHLFSPY